MKRGELRIGDTVRFAAKVYRKPFAPFYDECKGHTFRVNGFASDNSRIEVGCVDCRELIVPVYIHPDNLVKVK